MADSTALGLELSAVDGTDAGTADCGTRVLGTSRTVLLRQTILLFALTCIAIAFCSAQVRNDSLRKPPMGYELYSWQEPTGSWNFCLLPSPSGVYIQAEEVFNKKFLLRGVKGLNREISKLPVGATIYWLDRILPETGPKPKTNESLRYPPANIIKQVKQYAETRHIEIQMMSKNQ